MAVDKVRPAGDRYSDTERRTLELFRELGSVPEVAARRNLKEATIYGHLSKAVVRGELDAAAVTGLGSGEIADIEEAARAVRGGAGLTQLHARLDGRYSYDVLRCVLSGMNRE